MPLATQEPAAFNIAAVQAIVFDLGNVLLDLDNALYGNSWPQGIGADHHDFEQWVAGQNLWYDYETGRINQATFIDRLQQRLGLSPKQIKDYWNSILLGIPPQRLKLLEQLQERYPLYILSNTNEGHIDWVRDHVRQTGLADFESRFFVKAFYSYELGSIKPEALIYQRAQQAIGLPAEGLLFIDDKPENVLAAREQGWQACELAPGTEVGELLAPLLA